MKKLLATIALLLVSVTAHAAPVQTVLATTAKLTPDYYGAELTVQLPVGITPLFDPNMPGQNVIDPKSIVVLDTSRLSKDTLVSYSYAPSTTSSAGDSITIALSNINGIKFGTLLSLWADFKPGFSVTYDATSTEVNNVTFKIISYSFFDAFGNVIPSNRASAVINKTYVWQ